MLSTYVMMMAYTYIHDHALFDNKTYLDNNDYIMICNACVMVLLEKLTSCRLRHYENVRNCI